MAPLPLLANVEDLTDTLDRQGLSLDRATLALRRASGAIRGELHWNFTLETVTGYQPAVYRRTRHLYLPTLHLISVSSLTEGGVTLAAGTDYAALPHGELIRAAGAWSKYVGDISVTFTHGYSEGDPEWEDVRDACVALAITYVSNPSGHASETTGSESWTASGSAQQERAEILASVQKYALPSVA